MKHISEYTSKIMEDLKNKSQTSHEKLLSSDTRDERRKEINLKHMSELKKILKK